MRSGVECTSTDAWLGPSPQRGYDTVLDCALACARKSGCSYFIFGNGTKAGDCYAEQTESEHCPQGFEQDDFSFYKLHGGDPGERAATPVLLAGRPETRRTVAGVPALSRLYPSPGAPFGVRFSPLNGSCGEDAELRLLNPLTHDPRGLST